MSRTFLEQREEACGAQTVSHTFLEQKKGSVRSKDS